MELMENSVFEIINFDGSTYLKRVLWVCTKSNDFVSIDITNRNSLPLLEKISDISNLIEDGYAKKVEDPYFLIALEDNISEGYKNKRDANWKLISEIVNREPDIYFSHIRSKLIEEVCKDNNVNKKKVYLLLKRYWFRGKTKNSLLPDYSHCGNKGELKKVSDKKRGLPRQNEEKRGIGINVDEDIRLIFRLAIDKFYNNSKKNAFSIAYKSMLQEYFSEEKIIDGQIKVDLSKDIPSIRQFIYWYKKEYDIVDSVRKREGEKKYLLTCRRITGNSYNLALSPTEKYEIDATVADVYLVSRYNRNHIIGRPVVYAVIDVFSRMIAGIYVGLEGPSWIGAMMALLNVTTDKVEFCKNYGISIKEEDWPCHHMPIAILADRGEMEGRMPENLTSMLNISIENTPPYRADLKGIVERRFKTINEKVKPLVPGKVEKDFGERGVRDYRLDAKLNLDEFTKIIIHYTLLHMKNPLYRYLRDKDMIRDGVDASPINLWNWGIKMRTGSLRCFEEDKVKLALLPQAEATITEKGIRFNKMYYSCEEAIRNKWFENARIFGNKKNVVSYDPRNVDYLYIISEDKKGYFKCELLDNNNRYAGMTCDEVIYLHHIEDYEKNSLEHDALKREVGFIKEVNNIVDESTKDAKSNNDECLSKNARIKGIRNNRANEKNKNRENEKFIIGANEKDETAKKTNKGRKKNNEDPNVDMMNMIKRKQVERTKKSIIKDDN